MAAGCSASTPRLARVLGHQAPGSLHLHIKLGWIQCCHQEPGATQFTVFKDSSRAVIFVRSKMLVFPLIFLMRNVTVLTAFQDQSLVNVSSCKYNGKRPFQSSGDFEVDFSP